MLIFVRVDDVAELRHKRIRMRRCSQRAPPGSGNTVEPPNPKMRPKHKGGPTTRAARFALRHSLTRYASPIPTVELDNPRGDPRPPAQINGSRPWEYPTPSTLNHT